MNTSNENTIISISNQTSDQRVEGKISKLIEGFIPYFSNLLIEKGLNHRTEKRIEAFKNNGIGLLKLLVLKRKFSLGSIDTFEKLVECFREVINEKLPRYSSFKIPGNMKAWLREYFSTIDENNKKNIEFFTKAFPNKPIAYNDEIDWKLISSLLDEKLSTHSFVRKVDNKIEPLEKARLQCLLIVELLKLDGHHGNQKTRKNGSQALADLELLEQIFKFSFNNLEEIEIVGDRPIKVIDRLSELLNKKGEMGSYSVINEYLKEDYKQKNQGKFSILQREKNTYRSSILNALLKNKIKSYKTGLVPNEPFNKLKELENILNQSFTKYIGVEVDGKMLIHEEIKCALNKFKENGGFRHFISEILKDKKDFGVNKKGKKISLEKHVTSLVGSFTKLVKKHGPKNLDLSPLYKSYHQTLKKEGTEKDTLENKNVKKIKVAQERSSEISALPNFEMLEDPNVLNNSYSDGLNTNFLPVNNPFPFNVVNNGYLATRNTAFPFFGTDLRDLVNPLDSVYLAGQQLYSNNNFLNQNRMVTPNTLMGQFVSADYGNLLRNSIHLNPSLFGESSHDLNQSLHSAIRSNLGQQVRLPLSENTALTQRGNNELSSLLGQNPHAFFAQLSRAARPSALSQVQQSLQINNENKTNNKDLNGDEQNQGFLPYKSK